MWCRGGAQEALASAAGGQRGAHVARLKNALMQLRKCCNHPDLVTGPYDTSATYPSAAELAAQCGKLQLLGRLLQALKQGGHKVLIFSQVCAALTPLPTDDTSAPSPVCWRRPWAGDLTNHFVPL